MAPGVDWDTVGNRWDTGRTEAFSDSVSAFAITLLVLDINNVRESAFNHLRRAIADQWPSYLGYATSFLTVEGIWMVHHAIFRRVQYANRRVMEVNLVLLASTSFSTDLCACVSALSAEALSAISENGLRSRSSRNMLRGTTNARASLPPNQMPPKRAISSTLADAVNELEWHHQS